MPLGISGTFNFMIVFQAEHNSAQKKCVYTLNIIKFNFENRINLNAYSHAS
jgi:hypothetical protein